MLQSSFGGTQTNPIFTASNLPYLANTVFNAGAARVGDEVVLLVRVEDRRGISHFAVARSSDGVSRWHVDGESSMLPSPDTHPEEIFGMKIPGLPILRRRIYGPSLIRLGLSSDH